MNPRLIDLKLAAGADAAAQAGGSWSAA